MGRGRSNELDLPCPWIESSNHIGAALHGKPKDAVSIKHRRVWVSRVRTRQFVFGDFACGGVEFADITGEVGREPNCAVAVGDEAVRTRHRRVEMVFGNM